MGNKKRHFKRFYFSLKSLGWMLFSTFIFFGIYLVLIFLSNFLSNNPNIDVGWLLFLDVAQNAFLVLISVFSSSILATLLLERRDKNDISLDTVVKEVLETKDILNHVSEEAKENLRAQLNGTSCESQDKIFKDVCRKLFEGNPQYYFEECQYVIVCTVCKDHIRKEYSRKLWVRSYEDSCEVSNFKIAQMINKKIAGLDNFELGAVKINGEEIDKSKIACEINPEKNPVQTKNHYDTKTIYTYKESLPLTAHAATEIEIEYITRVDLEDTTLCCRVSEHCERFSLLFSIEKSGPYDIVGNAFGFLTTADDTPNKLPNSISFQFKDWIFKRCGVSIHFKKKKNEPSRKKKR